jgi:hypothetical protein
LQNLLTESLADNVTARLQNANVFLEKLKEVEFAYSRKGSPIYGMVENISYGMCVRNSFEVSAEDVEQVIRKSRAEHLDLALLLEKREVTLLLGASYVIDKLANANKYSEYSEIYGINHIWRKEFISVIAADELWQDFQTVDEIFDFLSNAESDIRKINIIPYNLFQITGEVRFAILSMKMTDKTFNQSVLNYLYIANETVYLYEDLRKGFIRMYNKDNLLETSIGKEHLMRIAKAYYSGERIGKDREFAKKLVERVNSEGVDRRRKING